jgi:autotransporter-associated beta strand protein
VNGTQFFLAVAACATGLIFSPTAQAQLTWSSAAADGIMSTGGNWVGGSAPASSGSSLTFTTSSTTALTNDFASLSVTGLTFNGSSAFILSGNAITLAGTLTVSNTTTAKTINTDLILSGNRSISMPNSSALTIGGAISGTNMVTKTGAGTLTLSGVNSFSGGLQINNGAVKLSGSGTLGSSTGTLTMAQSIATLDLNGTAQSVGNFTGAGGTVLNNASATNSTFTIGQGNTGGGTFSGAIIDHATGTGTMSLAKTGSGTVTLAGPSTFTGGTTVSAGTLTLGSSTALSGATGDFTLAGGTLGTSVSSTTVGGNLMFSSGSIDLNGTSAGTLTLASGKNFSMSGGTLNFTLGSSYDQIVSAGSGALSFIGGTISFDVAGVGFSYASSYQIFSGFGSASFGSLTLSGFDTAAYAANISSSGALSFSAAAVPEPSTYAFIAGVFALSCAVLHRRRSTGCAPRR